MFVDFSLLIPQLPAVQRRWLITQSSFLKTGRRSTSLTLRWPNSQHFRSSEGLCWLDCWVGREERRGMLSRQGRGNRWGVRWGVVESWQVTGLTRPPAHLPPQDISCVNTGQPTLSVSPLITNFTAIRRQAQPREHILTNSGRRGIWGNILLFGWHFSNFWSPPRTSRRISCHLLGLWSHKEFLEEYDIFLFLFLYTHGHHYCHQGPHWS